MVNAGHQHGQIRSSSRSKFRSTYGQRKVIRTVNAGSSVWSMQVISTDKKLGHPHGQNSAHGQEKYFTNQNAGFYLLFFFPPLCSSSVSLSSFSSCLLVLVFACEDFALGDGEDDGAGAGEDEEDEEEEEVEEEEDDDWDDDWEDDELPFSFNYNNIRNREE